MEELIDKLELDFYNEVESNKIIRNAEIEFTSHAPSNLIDDLLLIYQSHPLAGFYKMTNGLKLSWDLDLERNICGRMNIIELKYVLESWEEKLYFEEADKRLKSFHPLDVFTEEACVGILLNDSGDETLYYCEFGDSKIFSLDIDFKSYFDLAIDAKVFLYWQKYLVELVNGEQHVEITFKTGMKEVFPDFDLESFTAKFENMRLSKR
ncbi:MAG: hypothetical protein ACO1N0_19385 [Fluviicola sp.]